MHVDTFTPASPL